MKTNQMIQHRWLSILAIFLMVIGGLWTFEPTTAVQGATQYLGGYTRENDLRIQVLDNGRIGVERYTSSGTWERQIYGTTSKGSRLQWSNGNVGLGYFTGNAPTLVYNNVSSTGSAGSRTWTSEAKWTYASTVEVIQTLVYREGDQYFKFTWAVKNVGSSALSDVRFFHGEDTYLRNGDNGAGWVDWDNYTIGVKKNVGTEQRMSLQGITQPYNYQSDRYYAIYQAVNAGALTANVDGTESTDNGYALEWRNGSLSAGQTWSIIAYEKFNNVVLGAVQVTAPVSTECLAGNTCAMNFTVTNPGTSALSGVALQLTPSGTWSMTSSLPGTSATVSIPARSSVEVTVNVTVPSGVAANSSMNVTLGATYNGTTVSESSAINAIVPANSAPSSVSLSSTAIPENQSGVARTISGSDPDGDALTYSLLGTDASSFSINGTSLTNNAAFNYEAKSSYAITIRATDSKGATKDQAFTISVSDVNEAPTLSNPGAQTKAEDVQLSLSLTATDPDTSAPNNTLSWEIVTPPAHGSLSGISGSAATQTGIFNSTLNYNGADTFTIKVTDGGGLSAQVTVPVTITAVNDTPVNQWNGTTTFGDTLKVRINQTITFDQLSTTGVNHNASLIGVSDVDADTNLVQVNLSVTKGALALSTTAGISGADTTGSDGTYSIQGTVSAINTALKGMSYTPNSGYSGSDTLTIITSDLGSSGSGGAKTDTDTVSLAVSNPTSFVVDDNYTGNTAGWGWNTFANIEAGMAAAESVAAINGASGPALTVEVNGGSYTSDGVTINNSKISLSLSGDVTLGKDFALTSGAFTANGHKVTFATGPASQTDHVISGAPVFADLAAAEGNTITLADGANLGLSGTLTLPTPAALVAALPVGRTTLTLSGTPVLPTGLTVDNLTVSSSTTLVAPQDLTLTGNLTNSGTFDGNGGTLTFAGPAERVQTISGNVSELAGVFISPTASVKPTTSLNVSGDWNDQGAFDANGQTVNFSGADMTFSGETVFADLTLADTVHLLLADGADLGYSGALTLDGSASLDATSSEDTIIRLAGSTTQTLPVGLDSFDSLVVNPGASLDALDRDLMLSGDLVTNGALTNTDGSVTFSGPDGSEHAITIGAGITPQLGDVTIASGNTVTPTSGARINVSGNWNDQGSFVSNLGNVSFNGSAQTFSGETNFYDLGVNGTSTLTLAEGADFGYAHTFTLGGSFDAITHTDTIVRITGSASQNLPSGLNTLNSLAIDAGAILNANGRTLTVAQDLINNGSFSNSGGTLNFAAGSEHAFTNSASTELTQLGTLNIATDNSLISSCSAGEPIQVSGNWNKSGTYTDSSCEVIFNGNASQAIAGTGNSFYNLTINNTATFPNDTNDVDSISAVTVTNVLSVLSGQFQPATGSSFETVNLGGDLVGQTGILRPDRNGQFSVSGDWTRNTYGWFDANAGTVDFTGGELATIAGGATFYNLTVNNTGTLQSSSPVNVDNLLDVKTGTFEPSTNSKIHDVWIESGSLLKPAGNINISGNLTNDSPAGYDHNEKSVTFDGSDIQNLTGRVDFYNLTVNEGSTLRLESAATLGYEGAMVLNGSLDTATHPSNTVEVMGQGLAEPQKLPAVQVNNLKVVNGASLLLDGDLVVTGNMLIEDTGTFNAAGSGVTFTQNSTATPNPTFTGTATFGNVVVDSSTTLFLLEDSNFILSGTMTGAGLLDGKTQGADTTLTVIGAASTLPSGSRVDNLILAENAGLNLDAKTLDVFGDWTQRAGSSLVSTDSTVTFKGGDAQTMTGSSLNFDALMVEKDADSLLVSDVVTTTGPLTMTSGDYQPACGSVFDSVVINGGELKLDPEAEACQVTVRTDWTQTGGNFTPNSGSVVFDAEPSGSHALTGANLTFDGLMVADDDSVTLMSGTNLAVAGPAAIGGASWTGADTSTLTITGDVSVSGPMNLDNLVIAPTGTLSVPVAVTLNGDLTVQSTADHQGTFDNTGGSLTVSDDAAHTFINTPVDLGDGTSVVGHLIVGNLTVPALATLNLGSTVDSTDVLTVTGDWVNSGIVETNKGTAVFAGSTDQVIQSGAASNDFYNLTIANPTGTVTSKDLGSASIPLHVTNNLVVESGLLVVPADSTLVNVRIEPAGRIQFEGATTVGGHWDNRGVIESGSITEDTGFYLESALVDTAYTAGTPGFGFDKFATIAEGLGAAQDVIYVRNTLPAAYSEDLTLNAPDTTAKVVVIGDVTVNAIDLIAGEIEISASSSLTAASYVQSGGAFDLGTGVLQVNGNFATSDTAVFEAGSGMLGLQGDFTPAVGFDAGSGTVVFNGSTGQNINPPADFVLFNVTVLNTSALAGDDTDAVLETAPLTVSGSLDVLDGKFMPVNQAHFMDIHLAADTTFKLAMNAEVTVDAGGSLTRDAGSILNLNGGKILGLPQSVVKVDDDYTSADSGFSYDLFATIPSALTALDDISALDTGVAQILDGTYPGLELTNPNPRTLQVAGNVVISAGDLTITQGTLDVVADKVLNLPEDLIIQPSGTLSASGTVRMTGSTAQLISGNGLVFTDLEIANSGTELVSTNAPITVSDDLVISDGIFTPQCGSSFKDVTIAADAELRLPAVAEGETCAITVSGTWSVTGTSVFTPNGATVTFMGENAAIDGLAVFDSLKIASGATLTADADDVLTVRGDWTNDGGNFVPNGSQVLFDGSGPQTLSGAPLSFNNFSIGAASAVTLQNALTLTGNWNQNATGVFDSNAQAVTFNGDGPQTLVGPNPLTFSTFNVDKANDSALDVQTVLTISNHLEIANGELILNENTNVHNDADSATGHLAATGKVTLIDDTILRVDDWLSDGGVITLGNELGGLILGKVNQVIVDDSFNETTPGIGIDRFSTITSALEINYLTDNAQVIVNSGTYAEDVVVNRTVNVQFAGPVTLNSLTLVDDETYPAVNYPTVTAADSGALTLLGGLTVTNGTFDPNGGEIIFSGNASHTLTDALTLHDLTIAADAAFTAPATLTLTGDLTNLNELNATSLSVAGAVSNQGALTATTLGVSGDLENQGNLNVASLSIGGNLTDTGGFTAVDLAFSGTGAHALSGSVVVTNLTVPTANSLALNANAVVSLAGSLTLTDGAAALQANLASEIILTGADQTLPTGLTLGNLSIASGAGFTAPSELLLTGSLSNAGVFTANNGSVTLIGSDQQVLSGNPLSFYNLTIDDANDTDGANDTPATAVVNVTNTFTITDGSFSPTQCGTYASLTIGAEGVFAPQTDGTCAQAFSGNWVNDGVFTAGSSQITLNGTSAQSISGASQTSFNDLEVANSSGQAVIIASPLTLQATGAVTVSAGALSIPAGSSVEDVIILAEGSVTGPADNWTVTGDWSNAGQYQANNGSVVFAGTAANHTISGETTFYALTAEDVNTLNLASGSAVEVTYGLDLQDSAQVAGAPTSNLAFTGSGMISLPDSTVLGGLEIGPQTIFTAPANLTLQGNLTNAGSIDAGTGTITFLGAADKTLTGTVAFENLVLDGGKLLLAENAEVTLNGSLTQQNGSSLDGSAAGTVFIAAAGDAQILPGTVSLNKIQVTAGTTLSVPDSLTIYGDLDAQGNFNNDGGETIFAGPEGTLHYLTGNGTVTFGDLTIQPGNTLIMPDGKVISVTGNWTNDGSFNPANGTVIFNGTGAQALSGASVTDFANLVVNKSAGSLDASTAVNVFGALDLLSGTFAPAQDSNFGAVNITGLATLDAPTGNINVSGAWTNQGTFTPNSGTVTFNGSGEQRFVGNTTFDNLALNAGSTLLMGTGSQLGYTDGFTIADGGHLDATSNAGTTLVVAGDGDPVQTMPNGLTLNSLVVASPAILNGANTTVTLYDDLTVDGTIINGLSVNFAGDSSQNILGAGEVHLGDVTIGPDSTLVPGDRDLYVSGDWTNNNPDGGFTPGDGAVIFEGTDTQTIGGPTVTIFNDLTITGGPVSGPVVVTGDTLIETTGEFSPTNGSTFDNVTINGTLIPEQGAVLQVGGNWVDNGIAPDGGFIPNNSTVVFNSSDPQTIGGTNTPTPFYTLVIAGTGGVTAENPLDVNGDLRLEEGSPTFVLPDGSSLHNITINPGTTLQLEENGHFSMDGAWNNQGTFDANGGSLSEGSHPSIDAATVDPGCTLAGTCGVDRFATIQEAIDAINPDGEITVLAGTYAADGDGMTIQLPDDKPVRLLFTGDTVIEGNIVQGGGTIQAPTGSLTLEGNLDRTGGAFNANGGTVILNSGAEQTISGIGIDFDTLQIANGSLVSSSAVVNTATLLDIENGSYSPAVCGQHNDIRIGTNGIYTPGDSACINLSGDWVNNGVFTASAAEVTFNGAENQAIGGAADTTFAGLVIENRGTPGEVRVDPAVRVNVTGLLNVIDGIFIPSAGSVFNDLTIGTNGTLKPATGAEITVLGDLSNAGTFTPDGGTVVLSGGEDQNIEGEFSFYNLTVNKDPATAVVDFNAPVTVANELNLISGIVRFATGSDFNTVDVGANGSLQPDNGATFNISGNWTNAGEFLPNQSTVVFDGASPQVVTGVTDFYNLTQNNNSTLTFDVPIDVAGRTLIHDGEFNPLAGSTFNNVTIDEEGIFKPIADASHPEVTSIAVDGQMRNHGVFDLSEISALGNFTLDQVYVSPEYSEATPGFGVDHFTTIQESLQLLNLADNATITIYGGAYSGDVTVANDLQVMLESTSALDVNIDMDIAIGGSLVLNHADAVLTAPEGTLLLGGNLDLQAGTFTPNGGKVSFNGAASQHILGSLAFYDLEVNNSAVFTPETADENDVDTNASISVAGTLHIAQGQFSPLPCSSFHSVIIDLGAILKPQAGSDTCNSGLEVTGDWSSAGVFENNAATVTFNGTTPQVISGEDAFGNIVVNNPAGVTATAPFAAAGSVTVQAGSLTLPDGAQVKDVVILPNGELAMQADGTLTVTGDWDDQNPDGGFTANHSTVAFSGGAEQTYNGESVFANVTVDGPATLVMDDGANLTYSGAFDLNNGGALDATSNPDTTLTIIHTDTSPAIHHLPGPGDVQLNNLVIGPNVVLSGNDADGAGQNLTLIGDFTNNGTFNGGDGTVTFNGPADQPQTIGGTGDTNFNDLVISNEVTGNSPVDVTGEVHIDGEGYFTPADGSTLHDVLIDAGGTLDGSDGTLGVTGDWTNEGTFISGNGTVVFEGSEEQVVSGDNHFNNLTINKDCLATSGSECTDYASVTVNDPIVVDDTLRVVAGEFVQVRSGSSFGTIIVEDGGRLIAEDGATDIDADHLILANDDSFITPGGVFNPSNVLWNASQTALASVAEKPAGLTIGALYTVDLNLHEQNTFSYALSNENDCGVDNAYFRLVINPDDGLTYVETAQALDYETRESYNLCVQTTDETGRSRVRTLVIEPLDANDEPVVVEDAADGSTNSQITVTMDEDGAPTAFSLTLHGTDQDLNELNTQRDTLSWELLSSTTHGTLTIPNTYTGNDVVVDYAPGAENWNGSDQFRVRVTDGTEPIDLTVNIVIRPVNDPPVNVTIPAITPSDSAVIGERVQVSSGDWNDANDPELPGAINVVYQWQRADDDQGANLVNIVNATESAYYPLASEQGHYIRAVVTARNAGTGLPAVSSADVFSEWVYVPGQAPVDIMVSHETVAENLPIGSLVARISASDPDAGDVFTYELVAGEGDADNAKFAISGSELHTAEILHLAEQTTASIRVQVTDGGNNTYQRVFTFNIVGVQTDVLPKVGGTLVIPSTEITPGNTTINVPIGAVLDPITIIFTPTDTVDDLPAGVGFADNAFDLMAMMNGEEIKDYEFNKPITYTIEYEQASVNGIDENSLRLMIKTAQGWEDAACGDVEVDKDANILSVPLCKSGDFALVGNDMVVIYMPFIRK